MRKINRKRSSCFFAIHTCTPSKTSTPNPLLALKQMWMTAPLSKLCLHHLLPHPKAWCYHSNPLTTGNCLRQKGRKCKRGWGQWRRRVGCLTQRRLECKELIRLRVLPQTKGQASRQRLVGVRTGGGVGFPLPSGPFVWGRGVGEEGGIPWPLWVPKTPTRPPSSKCNSSRQTLSNSVNTIQGPSKTY